VGNEGGEGSTTPGQIWPEVNKGRYTYQGVRCFYFIFLHYSTTSNLHACFCTFTLNQPFTELSYPVVCSLLRFAAMTSHKIADEKMESISSLNSLSKTVTIDAELFEKLYLAPKTAVAGDLRKTFGNPTPV
jgi:hypothetical protein